MLIHDTPSKRFDGFIGEKMRKGQLLNAEICYELAKLRHTDLVAIADAGLPNPPNNVNGLI